MYNSSGSKYYVKVKGNKYSVTIMIKEDTELQKESIGKTQNIENRKRQSMVIAQIVKEAEGKYISEIEKNQVRKNRKKRKNKFISIVKNLKKRENNTNWRSVRKTKYTKS